MCKIKVGDRFFIEGSEGSDCCIIYRCVKVEKNRGIFILTGLPCHGDSVRFYAEFCVKVEE